MGRCHLQTSIRRGGLAFVLVAIAAIALVAWSCSRTDNAVTLEPVTVGMEATAVNSLIYIAESQGYFAANGLQVTLKDSYPSGAAAAEGMLKGEADVATAAELAIVRQAFAKQRIVAFATIDMFMHMKLVGRADRGIRDIPDLKGKRIGAPLKSAADFMLGRFLELNGIRASEITIVDVQAPQAVTSMTNGDVDALVAWQPNVLAIQDRLGDNALVWSVQSGQPMYCVAVTTGDWATKHPQLVKQFLNSLKQAEDYLVRNPSLARGIVQKRLGYDDRYVETIWQDHELSVRLDQSLITAMEDQARWMMANNLTPENQVPDFADYIYEDALRAVKPEAVNIIR
ncbi:MAG: ABC transporter substrate-binding protein [Dehalococcoidia bacterium]|nr:ABC transporter substrate-binding protein [Dehalococcoidia bacterium]